MTISAKFATTCPSCRGRIDEDRAVASWADVPSREQEMAELVAADEASRAGVRS